MANKKTQELLYAVIGAGDLTVEKIRGLRSLTQIEVSADVYEDFIKRGRSVSKRISAAAPTKRAVEQTKTARSQVKAAVTSITKAANANAKATRAAVEKIAKAS